MSDRYAGVAELADAHDSKSCSARSVGSTPTFGIFFIFWLPLMAFDDGSADVVGVSAIFLPFFIPSVDITYLRTCPYNYAGITPYEKETVVRHSVVHRGLAHSESVAVMAGPRRYGACDADSPVPTAREP